MLKRFVTSDTHFFHKNIIKHCSRPFDTVSKMNNVLINNWNSVVAPEDIVYVLGDFIWGNDKTCIEPLVDKLNGQIHLILGNHDAFKPWDYVNGGICSVHTTLQLEDNIYLAHDPATRCTLPDDVILIHGHIHTLYKYFIQKKCINVSVEMWDYKPVKIEDAIPAIFKEVKGEK